MYASECRRYAEQCLLLAQQLEPRHRDLLLKWADEWRRIAEELEEIEELEQQDLPEDRLGKQKTNG
jgi:hypothetical protein